MGVERGIAERGTAERDTAERGIAERGIAESESGSYLPFWLLLLLIRMTVVIEDASRGRRPSKRNYSAWLMRLTADFMPRECQKEAPSSNTADRLDDRSQLLPRKNQTNNDPKNVKKSSQI